jgi:hypothetical protein
MVLHGPIDLAVNHITFTLIFHFNVLLARSFIFCEK